MERSVEQPRRTVKVIDTSLRDGHQDLRSRLGVTTKLYLIEALDQWGVDVIEAGWPDSNPNDGILFQESKALRLQNATLAAFGRTAKAGVVDPYKDDVIKALLHADTELVTLVGKADPLHVTDALQTTLDENLRMIERSITALNHEGRRVSFDAEHFFDGYKRNPRYALKVLKTAINYGAEVGTLCDTNGGSHYRDVRRVTKIVRRHFPDLEIGIHVHNDRGFALISTLEAVEAGATQVQGVVNGNGERAGNTDLIAVVANLDHEDYDIATNVILTQIPTISRQVAEASGIPIPDNQPISGRLVWTDNAGLHASGTRRGESHYRWTNSQKFGRKNEIGFSDQGGGANIHSWAETFGISLSASDPEYSRILAKMKGGRVFGEAQIFHIFNAEKLHKALPFSVPESKVTTVIVNGICYVEAILKIVVNGDERNVLAHGAGPVDAFNKALLKGLPEYPELAGIKIETYQVPQTEKPGSEVEVEVRTHFSSNGDSWESNVSSPNIEEASQNAFIQSYQYFLMHLKH